MKGKLLYLGGLIYRDIVQSGVTETLSKEQRKKTIRLNQFVILALLVNFFSVLFYFYHKLYISALINITSAYFFLFAYYLNSKRMLEAGRIVSVINLNLYLLVISHVEGLNAGEYLLFFPYFLVLTFVVSIRKNFRELLLVYSITISAAFICLQFSPQTNDYQAISHELYSTLYAGNLSIAMFMTLIFSYAILRVNKDNEEAILQEKTFGDTIFNTSLDAVFILYNNTKRIASCNRRALELFEVKYNKEIEGTEIQEWFNQGNIRKFRMIEEAITTKKKGWQGELAFTTKTGKSFYSFVSVVPFKYKDTEYTKISILDISDVKMAEFELMKAKEKAESAASAKSRFLSNMSHELRTPLNGIIGACNLLFREGFLPEQKPHLDILKFSSEHMMMLINDILDLNKIEAGKVELSLGPLNIREFIDKVASQFRPGISAKGLTLEVSVEDSLDIEFLTDETRLYQILSNLVSNAVKFTHSGFIRIAVKRLNNTGQSGNILFIVEDSGIGIPPEKHREIFGIFTQADANTTRKYGGTGLGLAISKSLVNIFNSELLLESQPGKGSRFYFSIEMEKNNRPPSYISPTVKNGLMSFSGIRVLIAEDNKVNLSIARKFLAGWGMEVIEAVNGKLAVEQFNRHQLDLLLIDLEMPEMDGFTALKEIRKINPTIPALAFTAAVYENMGADLMSKGFVDFIRKPFRPEDLNRKIASVLPAVSSSSER